MKLYSRYYCRYRSLFLFASLFYTLSSSVYAEQEKKTAYVGAAKCASCHQDYVNAWKKSDHFHAMAEASGVSVLGDFNNKTFSDGTISSRFFTRDNAFFIETPNEQGKVTTYQVLYTFGYFPLQQYLVHTGNGHLQAFTVAWDNRPKHEGGQQWYDLQPDEAMEASSPFFWMGSFQNWNSRCAECHATNLKKNYQPASHNYTTTWAEINVACESCHGPAKNHLRLVQKKSGPQKHMGFARSLPKTRPWQFSKDAAIASPKGEKSVAHIDMCGGCHSRRMALHEREISESESASYHDTFRLQTMNNNLYFADGQIREEVYVLGSFLQSKMHAQGVTCMNCHNAHSGKLLGEPNDVCAQCHLPNVFDRTSHHIHPGTDNESPVQCVDCHMPERTYMGIDKRRDHSFTIPNPKLSLDTGVPNACLGCHKEKTNQWAINALSKANKKPSDVHWAQINDQLQRHDSLAYEALLLSTQNKTLAPIIRASFAEQLSQFPSQQTLETASKLLLSEDPLVRRGAITALSTFSVKTRWKLLSPLLGDAHQAVRFDALTHLIDAPKTLTRLKVKEKNALHKVTSEYMQSMALNADFPSTQLSLASMAIRKNEPLKALEAYQRALFLAPKYVPALLNLSDFYRQFPDTVKNASEQNEKSLLDEALKISPESSSAQHAMGLFHIRQKQYQKALPYLKAATAENLDANPRHSYVYAVALDSQGKTREAIRALQKANKRWPNQYQVLITLIAYLEKTNNSKLVYKYLSPLSRIAPDSAQVQALLQKYR